MSARHPVLQELLRAVPPPRTKTQRASAARKSAPKRKTRAAKPKAKRTPLRKTRKCTYVLPGELAQEFRVLCAVQEVTQREVIEQLVREFVGRHERLLPD